MTSSFTDRVHVSAERDGRNKRVHTHPQQRLKLTMMRVKTTSKMDTRMGRRSQKNTCRATNFLIGRRPKLLPTRLIWQPCHAASPCCLGCPAPLVLFLSSSFFFVQFCQFSKENTRVFSSLVNAYTKDRQWLKHGWMTLACVNPKTCCLFDGPMVDGRKV